MSERTTKRLEEHHEVTANVQNAKDIAMDHEESRISLEAIEAINLVGHVVELLAAKKKDEAISALQEAIKKLEEVINADPKLVFVPVDINEQIIDFPGTVEDVVITKALVVDLITDGKLQAAREIMMGLASEIDIYITELPLGTYPAVLKLILPLIEEEKYEEAEILLLEVMDTLVIEKIVIPLPVLRAEEAIKLAEEKSKYINNNGEINENIKQELLQLVDYAEEQLLLAQVLGYGRMDEDYEPLFEEIKAIRKKIENDAGLEDIFNAIKEKLSALISRLKEDSRKESKKEKNES